MTREPASVPVSDPAAVLQDRLWNDPRRRDDRSEFFECEHCGRAVRWVENLASEQRSSLQIVARPLATARSFAALEHRGLVAVFPDRTGFTVSRFTTTEDVEDALLYECHWDVCAPARTVRDRIHRERHPLSVPAEPDVEMQARYEAWRRGQAGGEQP